MQEILRRLANLENYQNTTAVYWSFAKWIAGALFIYIIGAGYYLWRWTRQFEERHRKEVNDRADGLFEHFGGEKEEQDKRIVLIDECNRENSNTIHLLTKEIEHEKDMRNQQNKACRDRCDAIRRNDKNNT